MEDGIPKGFSPAEPYRKGPCIYVVYHAYIYLYIYIYFFYLYTHIDALFLEIGFRV